MNIREKLVDNLGLKGLALLLAVLLWLFVAAGQEGEIGTLVPVRIVNLAPHLMLVSRPPERVDVRIVGPRLFLMKVHLEQLVIPLDLKNVGEGTVLFAGLEKALKLPDGARVTRVFPSAIELKIARAHEP